MSQGILKVLQPEGWAPAKGYANGIAARGEMIFVAGMIEVITCPSFKGRIL